MNRQLPAYGPITELQQKRIDFTEQRLRERRAAANYAWLPADAKNAEGAVNCAKCERLAGFNAERQGGWCLAQRLMVSTWHPVRCELFKAAT